MNLFFQGMQQDLKMAILAPILCAIFRFVFIKVWGEKSFFEWPKRQLKEVFCYGFWWGMDFNAYPYLISLLIVSIPSAFISSYFAVGDTVRIVIGIVYVWLLYVAFFGKMIFYYHYHDVYNRNIWLGKTADKGNLADIFFNQNHGGFILLGMIPYIIICVYALKLLLSIPVVDLPVFSSEIMQYSFNVVVFICSIAIYYWFHFGGTFKHRNKPEWDEVPPIVKQDVFLSKATMDDFCSLKIVLKHHLPEFLQHSDLESIKLIKKYKLPNGKEISDNVFDKKSNPLKAFVREAKGAKIKKPRRIFIVYGESHAQAPFDDTFKNLNMVEASRAFREDEHTFSLNNVIPAGLISQISLSGLLLGIFDCEIEINERLEFWQGTTPTALAVQLKKLGYSTHFWYGGKTTWGSLVHFTPAAGFDEIKGGPEICPAGSPSTWLGVYDHIFLENVARLVKENKNEDFEFHFVYTTSNHGPYDMPYWDMGFDTEKVMPSISAELKKDNMNMRRFAGVWYADQAINKFISDMKQEFPDSLFIVTGDHASQLIPYDKDLINRREQMLRETLMPCFHMYHREISRDMFANNTIGSHMNIMPTIIEMIAPKGFEYYSLFPSLFEHLDHVVSPHSWLNTEYIGNYKDKTKQSIEVSSNPVPMETNVVEYCEEMESLREITGWIIRHPELLENKERLININVEVRNK